MPPIPIDPAPPGIEVHNVYPIIDPALLRCAPEPLVPEQLIVNPALRDVDEHTDWVTPLKAAGADCRGKVNTLREIVESWPKP